MASAEHEPITGVCGLCPHRGPGAELNTFLCCDMPHWFLCIICLYFIAKTCTEIKRQAAIATLGMMYPARGVWIGIR